MAVEPTYPVPLVTVGTEDVTDLIVPGSLSRLMSERGEASCTFAVQLSGENEVASNAIVRDAVVQVYVESELRWYGHVVNVEQPQPDDAVLAVECAGQWDVLHQKEDYCKAFVETRYDGFIDVIQVGLEMPGTTKDTDGQVLITVAKDTAVLSAHKTYMYLPVLSDMDPSAGIRRVTFDYSISGNSANITYAVKMRDTIAWGGTDLFTGNCAADDADSFDSGDLGANTNLYLQVGLECASSFTTTAECGIQITNLCVYVDRTTAPTVDTAVTEIWTDVTGLSDTDTDTIGSALSQCVVDPFVTPADAIGQILAKATVPPLCGVVHNQFRCLTRPTTPPDSLRVWVVSEATTPGLQWQVKADMASSKDYVALSYTNLSTIPTYDGLPRREYYPSTPANLTDRVALVDSGSSLTYGEAVIAAEQAYHYYHDFVQGAVVIPYYARNGNGQEVPVEHIECWDWVLNAGKANTSEAGPFLISEVSIEDGVASLTIGATEGYAYESPYRLPTKGRYIGAHRHRRKRRKKISYDEWWKKRYAAYYKKHHKYPKQPKDHPKYKFVWERYWHEDEGRYV